MLPITTEAVNFGTLLGFDFSVRSRQARREIYRLFSVNGALHQPKPAENFSLFALISLAIVGSCRLA
jgi:hypothetical protein